MNRDRWMCVACVAIAGSLSGCAIYDPWQVWRYQANWNTERGLSAQIAFYDHLPPTPVRTRLMQWSYNVGPPGMSGAPAGFAIPDGAPVGPVLPPAVPPPAPPALPRPALPPAPTTGTPAVQPPDLLDRSRPPELPLSPPRAIVPPGPTAGNPIQRLSGTTEEPPTTAAWLFAH